jgi:hypothetical protein
MKGDDDLREDLSGIAGIDLPDKLLNRRDDGDEPETAEDSDDDPSGETQTVEFGTLDAANEFRDDHEAHLAAADKRITKTITFAPGTPDDVIEQAENNALTSRGDEVKRYDQAKLTEDEKDQLRERDSWDWNSNFFEAMWAKGALTAEGATDWLNYYEAGMDQDDALAMLDRGKEAEATTGAGTGIKGERIDSEQSMGDMARQAEKVEGQMCQSAREACESGEPEACEELLKSCDYTEEEIERLTRTAAVEMGEDPSAVFRKAWGGYKLARKNERKAVENAEKYAEIINGVRAVNGQDPLEFEELDGWAGGEQLPDDPSEEFPTDDGQKSVSEAVEEGHVSASTQAGLGQFVNNKPAATDGGIYDPTEDP